MEVHRRVSASGRFPCTVIVTSAQTNVKELYYQTLFFCPSALEHYNDFSDLCVCLKLICQTFSFEGSYAVGFEPIQDLEPQDYDVRLQFCKRIDAYVDHCLFTFH